MRNNILDGCSIEHLCHPRILPQNNKKITKSKYKRGKTLANDLDLKEMASSSSLSSSWTKQFPIYCPYKESTFRLKLMFRFYYTAHILGLKSVTHIYLSQCSSSHQTHA